MTLALQRIQQSRPFSPPEKLDLGLEILSVYLHVRWRLLRNGLPQTVSALRSQADGQIRDVESPATERVGFRLGGTVGRMLGYLPFDSRCLMRSLVLLGLLARRGIDSTLVVAVRSEPGFEAHAWVERNGAPLLRPGGSDYQRIVEL